VVRKVSDLVYRIQMRKREANMHVEQLKLCRDSREELRDRRQRHRCRMRPSAPPRARASNGSRRRNVGKLRRGPAILVCIVRETKCGWIRPHSRRKSRKYPGWGEERGRTTERDGETDDAVSENYEESPTRSYAPYEEQSLNESNCKVGRNPPAEGER
jgi:hypothetical protein